MVDYFISSLTNIKCYITSNKRSKKRKKLKPKFYIKFVDISIYTLGSILTYLDHQDNLSLVPNCSLGPPECKKDVPKNKPVGAL